MTDPAASTSRDQWLGVELRHLAALAAIASAGSFRGAAAQLGYVQSAVSQQIAFLERTVGLRLVERGPGPTPVRLTHAGRVLLGHADRMLSRLRAARADVNALGDGGSELRLGLDPTVVRTVLPEMLVDLATESPTTRVTPVWVVEQAERLALVEQGLLEAAFIDLPVGDGPFEMTEVAVDPYVLLVRKTDRIARLERSPTLEELSAMPLLGHSAAMLVGNPALGSGVFVDPVVQALVAAGRGAAIVPRLAVDDLVGTVAIDIGDIVPPRTVGLCWHRDRRTSEMLDALRRTATRRWLAGSAA